MSYYYTAESISTEFDKTSFVAALRFAQYPLVSACSAYRFAVPPALGLFLGSAA